MKLIPAPSEHGTAMQKFELPPTGGKILRAISSQRTVETADNATSADLRSLLASM